MGCDCFLVALVHLFERFGDDADAADGCDEICVAGPSGDNVRVEVLWDSGSCGASLVDADVDTLALKCPFDELGGSIDELPQLGALGRCIVEQSRAGFTERDEEMPVGVGISIEQDESVGVALDDSVLGVAPGILPIVDEERGSACGFGRGSS